MRKFVLWYSYHCVFGKHGGKVATVFPELRQASPARRRCKRQDHFVLSGTWESRASSKDTIWHWLATWSFIWVCLTGTKIYSIGFYSHERFLGDLESSPNLVLILNVLISRIPFPSISQTFTARSVYFLLPVSLCNWISEEESDTML